MDDTTDLSKRVRPPKTDAQKRAAAAASARNREKNRAAGIPSAPAIDTAIATVFLRHMYSKAGLHAHQDAAENLIKAISRRGGWDVGRAPVRKAIEHRIAALCLRSRQPAGRTIEALEASTS